MDCCSCFGFLRKPKQRPMPISSGGRSYNHNNINNLSQELLLNGEIDDNDDGEDDASFNGDITGTSYCDNAEVPNGAKRSEEILRLRELNGLVCRQYPVKETHLLVPSEDENGNKMVNEYVREYKIGAGSYGKVVLYRSSIDGKHYAIKAFHKSHLLKLRVAPSETAMSDVLREVLIMKMVDHPNIVNLIEVIDDPTTDHFYMVLEYVDGKRVWDGSGPPGGIGEDTARKYLRDVVSGLMYLHAHDDNDELRRSPGTPVFTAPECCVCLTYHGKAADTWAVGVTLYCMILGQYPFLGETLHDTYDKIVNNPLVLPDELNAQLKDLLEGLLCKDPARRITLAAVTNHTWVIGDEGPIPQYLCWCKHSSMQREGNRLMGATTAHA
ncbi:PREDICTED: serine/threonine-protein kinase GRIK2-like isoform X2 [Populus euphratica]|uniref:non-specific serine/threonine protein kinase n=1 Tax=Populus euphratica TaxID=75702 RepID=A0AAJ6V4C1_POPEU|nr:PREDICTED: serine/threonine-protein kinase GRIK2-like isoform X2 [Populus euphratica]